MTCCVEELCRKDVINVENGCRIGFVCDVEVEVCSGQVTALRVEKNERGFSFKKRGYATVCWSDIVVIGSETILVKNVCCEDAAKPDSKKLFDLFLK